MEIIVFLFHMVQEFLSSITYFNKFDENPLSLWYVYVHATVSNSKQDKNIFHKYKYPSLP